MRRYDLSVKTSLHRHINDEEEAFFFVFLRPEGQNVENKRKDTRVLQTSSKYDRIFINEKNPINRFPLFICTRAIAARTFL